VVSIFYSLINDAAHIVRCSGNTAFSNGLPQLHPIRIVGVKNSISVRKSDQFGKIQMVVGYRLDALVQVQLEIAIAIITVLGTIRSSIFKSSLHSRMINYLRQLVPR